MIPGEKWGIAFLVFFALLVVAIVASQKEKKTFSVRMAPKESQALLLTIVAVAPAVLPMMAAVFGFIGALENDYLSGVLFFGSWGMVDMWVAFSIHIAETLAGLLLGFAVAISILVLSKWFR